MMYSGTDTTLEHGAVQNLLFLRNNFPSVKREELYLHPQLSPQKTIDEQKTVPDEYYTMAAKPECSSEQVGQWLDNKPRSLVMDRGVILRTSYPAMFANLFNNADARLIEKFFNQYATGSLMVLRQSLTKTEEIPQIILISGVQNVINLYKGWITTMPDIVARLGTTEHIENNYEAGTGYKITFHLFTECTLVWTVPVEDWLPGSFIGDIPQGVSISHFNLPRNPSNSSVCNLIQVPANNQNAKSHATFGKQPVPSPARADSISCKPISTCVQPYRQMSMLRCRGEIIMNVDMDGRIKQIDSIIFDTDAIKL